ncbi:SPFH domain-containing protein [Candidatus Uabimicrobium sp. HlEnr_7]|uniref:SPFH domain-containing protein n=1 Tax=Candidatus Uabimicrobium helgolandensis TaxID=3095367 RepID=UPI0035572C70
MTDRRHNQTPQYQPSLKDISPLLTGTGIVFVLLIGFALAIAFTGITIVKPGEVALIMNNITGTATPKVTNGTIVHLPFGMTKVYKLDKTQQPIRMQGHDGVQIKTNDGSNVTMNVEVQYQVIPAEVQKIIKIIGRGDRYKQGLVRAYTRSIIRDTLGTLSVTEIANPSNRDGKLDESKTKMNESLVKYGITVSLITATNPKFNSDYEMMIKKRKEADQEVRNQRSAQITAQQEQYKKVAEATRIKKVAIRKAEGELVAKIIVVVEKAKQMLEKAEAEGYTLEKQGEQALVEGKNESEAILIEGLAKAEAIKKLSEAYEKGGQALVREALAEKFRGVILEGRPYSLSTNIDRFKMEKIIGAQEKK